MAHSRILLIEDEPGLAASVSGSLAAANFAVEVVSDSQVALTRAVTGHFDLIVMEGSLAHRDGFDLNHHLAQQGIQTPVLLLTPPFDSASILARMEALLRIGQGNRHVQTYEFGDVLVDFRSAEVHKSGHPVSLASKEFRLLRYLIDNRERVVPREEILTKVWEYASQVSSRTIDTHVAWLRQKLEDHPQNPVHIQTIRGKGYRFSAG